MRRVLFCMILLMVFCWPLVHRASAAPRVVVSIKPVHSLVAGGAGEMFSRRVHVRQNSLTY